MPEQPNVEYGDSSAALPHEIPRSVVGSGVHGIAIEGTDDHDEMGDAVRALLDEDRSPHAADLDRIGACAIDAQRRHWGWT